MTTYLAARPEISTLSVIRGRHHLFDLAAALDTGYFVAADGQLCLAYTDAMNVTTLRFVVSLGGDLATDMLRIYLDHGDLAIPDCVRHAYWTIEVSTPTRRLSVYPAKGGWFVPLPNGAIRSVAIADTRRGPQGPDHNDTGAHNDDGCRSPMTCHPRTVPSPLGWMRTWPEALSIPSPDPPGRASPGASVADPLGPTRQGTGDRTARVRPETGPGCPTLFAHHCLGTWMPNIVRASLLGHLDAQHRLPPTSTSLAAMPTPHPARFRLSETTA